MNRPDSNDQTYVCVLTPAGRGAVAVVAVEGPNAVKAVDHYFLAKNGRSLDQQPLSRIIYGHWGSADGEDLVVCRRTEDIVEVHCHGGTQSVAAVVSRLVDVDCRQIPWQQWAAHQYDCLLTAEAQIALAEAASSRTSLILLDQFHGALRREIGMIRATIQAGEFTAATTYIENILVHVPCGLHLTKPWQVVIAGRPNVGKSSLINALVGYRRAIVFDQPGTTRDVVSSTTVIEGWPVQLSDTAGLHTTNDTLEAAGIEQARTQLSRGDLVLWVEDATVATEISPHVLNQRAAELNLDLPERQLVAVNKIDLTDQPVPSNLLATSTLTGQGIKQLLSAIVQQLVPTPPASGTAIPFTTRQAGLLQAAARASEQGLIAGASDALDELLDHQ